ncbi:5254_t:CDS:2, partial [Racocetra persica]
MFNHEKSKAIKLLNTMHYLKEKNKDTIIFVHLQNKAIDFIKESLYQPNLSIQALKDETKQLKYKNASNFVISNTVQQIKQANSFRILVDESTYGDIKKKNLPSITMIDLKDINKYNAETVSKIVIEVCNSYNINISKYAVWLTNNTAYLLGNLNEA